MAAARRDHRGGELSSDGDEESGSGVELRRGPWTVEEDMLLVNYVAAHGEGRWNALARCAGLRRTGKSCRLRWLNYLRPDLRRGNITAQEQLLILELHARWGNRWSKIAQHLPGRTDNEIKNYWRTRVQKHARQLNCDVNSQRFKDIMRYIWMPRLLERIGSSGGEGGDVIDDATLTTTLPPTPPPTLEQLSCTNDTAVSSSSVSSTDSMLHHHHQQQLLPPPPAVAEYGYAIDHNSGSTAMSSMWNNDTLQCQPSHSTTWTCSGWSDDDSLLLVPSALTPAGGGGGVYSDNMHMVAFPDLICDTDTDTMWAAAGTGADDLWFTHIMGL